MEEIVKEQALKLVNLRKTTKSDVKEMESFIKEHLNQNIKICTFCVAQIKMAQRLILNWLNENSIEQIVIEDTPKSTGCQSCKKKPGRPKK